MMKTKKKKAKKVYENINYYKHKLYLYSELAPMTLDVTHSKRQGDRET